MTDQSPQRTGGIARAAKLEPNRRTEIASAAARARWAGHEKSADRRQFSMPMSANIREALERIRRRCGHHSLAETVRELILENDQASDSASAFERARTPTIIDNLDLEKSQDQPSKPKPAAPLVQRAANQQPVARLDAPQIQVGPITPAIGSRLKQPKKAKG